MHKTLTQEGRNLLTKVTLDAREAAERAAKAALEHLAVHEKDSRPHMKADERLLRNRLRARGRALGDVRDERSGAQRVNHLVEAVAYEEWHRLLFTRFLAENGLLRTDEEHGSVPVTLDECEELAREKGIRDGFELACRFASRILPGVFRSDDPILEITLAPNDEVELRRLLDALPSEVFKADDALGWTYQFWQGARKDEVNRSGKKIGADELAAVTQLFTEDYMVEFLLHNTIGAWWAGKRGPVAAASEEEARQRLSLPAKGGFPGIEWSYLRLVQDESTKKWTPAAGAFTEWPKAAKDITFLDPCMGSGHFPVFALPILARLRMEEEGLFARDAVTSTLRDNIHGLELDLRCTQIGVFNLALTAWKLAGWQPLPAIHVACCGLAPQARLTDWLALAGRDERLHRGMEQLYRLFSEAPTLGSLINPRLGGDMLDASFADLSLLLSKAMDDERVDEATHERAVQAQGIATAARLLSSEFVLVATNVPYLGRGKQSDILRDYCESAHTTAKADLATCFVQRCLSFCKKGASAALVTPQNWMFLATYQHMRRAVLTDATVMTVAELGAGAFQTPLYDFSFALVVIMQTSVHTGCSYTSIVASSSREIEDKIKALVKSPCSKISIASVRAQGDWRILTRPAIGNTKPLSMFATPHTGLQTGDNDHYSRLFWEIPTLLPGWEYFHRTSQDTKHFGGRMRVLYWEDGKGGLVAEEGCRVQGLDCRGKRGVLVHRMGDLPATLFTGEMFDQNGATIIPVKIEYLTPLWCYLSSDDYKTEVRKLDNKVGVTPATLVKVPFDLEHWQAEAAEKYPQGLPRPSSNDPTQWLFSGHPAGADQPLQVAVARLLGHRWPRLTGSSFADCPAINDDGLDSFADDDGVVCLPALNREQPAAARLRTLLAAAYGKAWCAGMERDLLAAVGSERTSLEDWLRDEFFEQHCEIFHHRPFTWHVWDGRKDGFHVLLNYHRLNSALLEKVTYRYLSDWIRQQTEDAKADKAGAAERLGAAKTLQAELKKILEGEAPYDIFVRWKPLDKQPLGWHPDLNDGVRANIRPFMTAEDIGRKGAGVLRAKPSINWDKDRGKEPERDKADFPWFWCEDEPEIDRMGGRTPVGTRWNDVHLTLARKRAARGKS